MSFIRVLREEELIQVSSSEHPGKDTFKYPGTLGMSPVDEKEFTFKAFNSVLEETSTKMIKDVLTFDQSKIAGIGNGYFQEIIFKAKIHPKRKAGELSEKEREALYRAITEVLSEAIELGGKDDILDLYGNKGGYNKILGAHSLGKPCPDCGTAMEGLDLLGSRTYCCPSCQK
jgi:formamidopyrimidine-DNA glycosylase